MTAHAPHRPPRRRCWRRARGVATGLVAGVGALLGHQAAGGEVTALPAAVVVLVSVALGVRLVRATSTDLVRSAGLAVAVQALSHAVFLMSPASPAPTTHAHGHGAADAATAPGLMLALHLAVAALTAGAATGVDRVLLDVARAVMSRLLPRLPRPGVHVVADLSHAFRSPAGPVARTARTAAPARAPPARPLLPTTIPA